MNQSALYVLLCYVLWGMLPIYWKQLGAVHSLYILAARIVFSMIFCAMLLRLTGQWKELKTLRQDKKQMKLTDRKRYFSEINKLFITKIMCMSCFRCDAPRIFISFLYSSYFYFLSISPSWTFMFILQFWFYLPFLWHIYHLFTFVNNLYLVYCLLFIFFEFIPFKKSNFSWTPSSLIFNLSFP